MAELDEESNSPADVAELELEENDANLIAEIEGNAGGSDDAQAEDGDRFSFEDSERFEEESLCSLPSENGSLNHKWRGWAPRNFTAGDQAGPSNCLVASGDVLVKNFDEMSLGCSKSVMPVRDVKASVPAAGRLRRLDDLAARKLAQSMSFETLESMYQTLKSAQVPGDLFIFVLKRCFPESEKDIRLYSCLANTHSNQFSNGEHLYQAGAVNEIFQIGYLVQAKVNASMEREDTHIELSTANEQNLQEIPSSPNHYYNVSIRVDKCRIVSCECSCSALSSWCQHVVAVCLQRIYKPATVKYRITVWDSITSLSDTQVKKLAQYLINELPREYLTTAQKIMDDLKQPKSEIYRSVGAPDPTADGPDDGIASWYMNEKVLHENIYQILANFVRPAPTVHCDVQYLSSSSPPASNEWNVLIRPLRAREPEALWNLLSIVREMLKRGDENASNLLHIITVDCLRLEQLVIWWYQTSLCYSGYWQTGSKSAQQSNATQRNVASLCDEIVALWRLVALNPKLTPDERDQLATLLQLYHRATVNLIWKRIENNINDTRSNLQYYALNVTDTNGAPLSTLNATFSKRLFPGFFPALQACHLNWRELDFGRALKDLEFSRVQKVIQSFKAELAAGGRQSPELISEFRNIPLLLNGPEALAAEITETVTTVLASMSMTIGSFEQSKAERAKAKRRKANRRYQRTHRQQRDNRHRQRSRQQQQRVQGLLEQNAVAAESSDSMAEDEELDDGQGPSCSSSLRNKSKKEKSVKREVYMDDLETLFASAHCELDGFAARFTCCEALLSYGYSFEAFVLASRLAQELLHNPPNLLLDGTPDKTSLLAGVHLSTSNMYNSHKPSFDKGVRLNCRNNKRSANCEICATDTSSTVQNNYKRRFVPPSHARIDASQLAVTTLSRTIFIVRILVSGYERDGWATENLEQSACVKTANAMALELGMQVLRNPRGPAATKSLEVRIYHLEHELLALMRKIIITPTELTIVRRFALDYLCELKNAPASRIIVPPLSMAQYVLDALGGRFSAKANSRPFGLPPLSPNHMPSSTTEDDELALAISLETLGMRVFVLEADHPMLCECIRRQRGDLAMTLLLRNRDSISRLAVILDKVLDSDVHQMYSSNISNASFFWDQLDSRHAARKSTQSLVAEILSAKNMDLLSSTNTNNAKMNKEDPAIIEPMGTGDSDLSNSTAPASQVAHESVSSVGVNDDEANALLECVTFGKRASNSSSTSSGPLEPPSQILSNMATEAQAHFMVEFAKRLLTEAGGNQSHTMFISLNNGHGVAPANGQAAINNANANGPHRNLHICSFLSGLYALGLNNLVSSTWPTRTYSTHVSWIQAQAMEIGRPALQIVRETWESHLTPTEVASLADKASQSADLAVVEEGAYLALSVLPKAFALTAIESQKALNQCKDQCPKLLERACLAVERAAEKDGVYPEVLFKVAHHWYNLYVESAPRGGAMPPTTSFNYNTAPPYRQLSRPPYSSHVSAPTQRQEVMYGGTTPAKVFPQPPFTCPPPPPLLPPPLSSSMPQHCATFNGAPMHGKQIHTPIMTGNSSGVNAALASELAAAKTQAMIDEVVQQHHPRLVQNNIQKQQQQRQHNPSTSGCVVVQPPQQQPQQQHQQQQENEQQQPHQQHPPQQEQQQPQQQHHHHQQQQQRQHNPPASIYVPIQQQPQQQQQQKLQMPHPNMYPYSANQLNIATTSQYGKQHMEPNSTSGRLHLSHSAPNLQPASRNVAHFQPQIPPPPLAMGMPMPPLPLPLPQPPLSQAGHCAYGNSVSWNSGSQFHGQTPGQEGRQMAGYPGGTIPSLPLPGNVPQAHMGINIPPPPPIMPVKYCGNQPRAVIPTTSGLPPAMIQHPPSILSAPVIPHLPQHPQTTHGPVFPVGQSHAPPLKPPLQKPILPRFLINAHRVGMRAMDTMGQRNLDDNRSFTKYSRTPSFGDDIRWLFEEVSVKLGDAYVHSFCEKACTCIASPFLLFQLAKEIIKYFKLQKPPMPACLMNVHMQSSNSSVPAPTNASITTAALADQQSSNIIQQSQMGAVRQSSAQVRYLLIVNQMYPPSVADLIRHCVEMVYMAAYNKLNHSRFNESDIEDTVELVLTAREMFALIPPQQCRTMFETFLRFVRKQKACKKEPIQRINSALHPTPAVTADS